jgi:hypothetical protein
MPKPAIVDSNDPCKKYWKCLYTLFGYVIEMHTLESVQVSIRGQKRSMDTYVFFCERWIKMLTLANMDQLGLIN